MGATDFMVRANGKTAKLAFNAAVEEAEYLHGHDGYTGSIAEKEKFVMIECPDGTGPFDYAEELLESDDDRISDKYGPAGCIQTGPEEFLFFGYAST